MATAGGARFKRAISQVEFAEQLFCQKYQGMSERLKGKVGMVHWCRQRPGVRLCRRACERRSIGCTGRQTKRPHRSCCPPDWSSGHRALAIAGDVTRSADIDRVVDQTIKQFGTLNLLLNHAGILQIGKAEQITKGTFNSGQWLSGSLMDRLR